MPYRYLTTGEINVIRVMAASGATITATARAIGRDRNTIYRHWHTARQAASVLPVPEPVERAWRARWLKILPELRANLRREVEEICGG
jgi:transposase-like protein